MGAFSMNPDEYRGSGTDLNNESQNFGRGIQGVMSGANAMDGAWEGPDKESFDAKIKELQALLVQREQELSSAGNDMTKTGDDADATTEENTRIINGAF